MFQNENCSFQHKGTAIVIFWFACLRKYRSHKREGGGERVMYKYRAVKRFCLIWFQNPSLVFAWYKKQQAKEHISNIRDGVGSRIRETKPVVRNVTTFIPCQVEEWQDHILSSYAKKNYDVSIKWLVNYNKIRK